MASSWYKDRSLWFRGYYFLVVDEGKQLFAANSILLVVKHYVEQHWPNSPSGREAVLELHCNFPIPNYDSDRVVKKSSKSFGDDESVSPHHHHHHHHHHEDLLKMLFFFFSFHLLLTISSGFSRSEVCRIRLLIRSSYSSNAIVCFSLRLLVEF